MRSIFSFLLGISSLFIINETVLANGTLSLEPVWAIATRNNVQFKTARTQLEINEAKILTAQVRLNLLRVSKIYRLGLEHPVESGLKQSVFVVGLQAQREVTLTKLNAQLLEFRSEGKGAYKAQKCQPSYVNTRQELVGIARKREKANGTSQAEIIKGLQAATQIELENCPFQDSTCSLIPNTGVFS